MRRPRQPTLAKKKVDRDEAYHIDQLQLLHHVIQAGLHAVNRMENLAALNVITGKDLLYCVGRLSMMINEKDYLPIFDCRPLPFNWTQKKFLDQRKGIDADEVLLALQAKKRELLLPSYVNLYNSGELVGVRKEMNEVFDKLRPLLWAILPYLDAKSLVKLATTSKTFLLLTAFAPPQSLLKIDKLRQEILVHLAVSACQKIKDKKLRIQDLDMRSELLMPFVKGRNPGFSKGERNKVLQTLLPRYQKSVMSDVKPDEYALDLAWGSNQVVRLVNRGSVRLIFSQGAEIIRLLEDNSEADDLSYERIVKYLSGKNEKMFALVLLRHARIGLRRAGKGVTENPGTAWWWQCGQRGSQRPKALPKRAHIVAIEAG